MEGKAAPKVLRAQRRLEVGMGFKGHPIPQKPALWLGPNVAAEDGSCEGAGGRSSAGWPHTFPSSPAPHALASSVETFQEGVFISLWFLSRNL